MTHEAQPPTDGTTHPDAPRYHQPEYHRPAYDRPVPTGGPGAVGAGGPGTPVSGPARHDGPVAPLRPDAPLAQVPGASPYGGPGGPAPHPGPAAGGPPPHAGLVAGGPVPPPPREAWAAPRRVEPVPGTPFAVVHLDVSPVTSGPAVGSLVAGIGAILVSLLVVCFGLAGADQGWGGWVAGAFAVLAVLLGAAGIGLGLFGRRQVDRPTTPSVMRFTGRGMGTAGLVCGAVGAGLTLLALAAVLALASG